MQIQELKNILTVLRNAKILEVAVEKKEGTNVLFRGKDKIGSVVVYHQLAMEQPPAYMMGIHKLDVLLDRLSLFDLSTAVADMKVHNSIAKMLTITQGRKKVSFTFADPDNISPKYVSEDAIVGELTFDKDNDLFDAVNAMNPDTFILEGSSDGVKIRLFDGTSDSYEDASFTEGNLVPNDWSNKWRVDSITMLLKESLKYNKTATIKVGARGLLFIDVGNITFTVVPVVEGL